jgi:hypothetical protein
VAVEPNPSREDRQCLTPPLRSHVAYAEILVGKALALNNRSKPAKRAREALLLAALRELQAEMQAEASAGRPTPA